MSAARETRGLLWVLLARLFRPLEGKTWLLAASLAFFCVIGLTTYHLWQQHGDRIVSHPQYRLKPDRLLVTPQPDWIRSDVRQSAVTQGRLHNANLLDEELALQVKQAFGVQPWVKRVVRVNKRFPSTVEVDLEYRRPLAMVVVPAGMFPDQPFEGVLPVDDEGFLLPVEITKHEAVLFPKITGIDSSPAGPPGSPWGDTRVAEAAQIIALLNELWDKLGLARIEVPRRSSPVEPPVPQDYVLITRGRKRIPWGAAPGKERPGTQSAAEKVVGLKAIAEQHGTLDSFEDPAAVDLSSLFERQRTMR